MLKNIKIISCCLALALLSACTSFNGHYTAISNKPLNLYDLTRPSDRVVANVDETSARNVFVIIPTGKQPTIEDAVANILNKYHGDYLQDAYIYHTSFHILWLYHYSAWDVRGNVMKIR